MPTSNPWSVIWSSSISVSRIGVVRLGPMTSFLLKSIRINCGAPISSARPFSHCSPRSQLVASTVAQISAFSPSINCSAHTGTVIAHSTAITAHKNILIGNAPLSCLLDHITLTLHACAKGFVELLKCPRLCLLSLLLLCCLVLPRLPTAGHGPNYGTCGCALSGITGNGTYRCTSSCASGSATYPLTTTRCRTRLLSRSTRHRNRVDPGPLLRPCIALSLVFVLLLGRLSLRGIRHHPKGR